MKAIRGTPYRSAWRQTVSDCGSTPATASKTATAPSRTRRLRSTSTVKSTCPGVSMMLIAWSRHWAVVAADVIVIPRSFSWTIQSMVEAPSWTSPILWMRPAEKRMRSVVVVLPASICAMIPMFRTLSITTGRSCIFSATLISLLVPEVGESLVTFRHPVGFLFALHRSARVLGSVKQLYCELLQHALPATLPSETDDPAPRQRQPALWSDLDRYLVGRATDASRLDLEQRGGVPQGQVEHLERLFLGLLPGAAQGVIDDLLGGRPLALAHHHVHELGDRLRLVHRVGRDDTLDWTAASRHLGRLCLFALRAVLGARLLAVLRSCGVERAADDVVADARHALGLGAAGELDRGLL